MRTYRFPLKGKIGIVRGLNWDLVSRLICAKRRSIEIERPEDLYGLRPLTEEEVRNLPVAHRYSA